MCFGTLFTDSDLKNRLLDYDMDQRQLKSTLDYSSERILLADLLNFNKLYKKKPKKTTNEGTKKTKGTKKKFNDFEGDSFEPSESEEKSEKEIIMRKDQ